MVTFSNPFLSVAGQVERLTNVKKTLVAAVTGKGVSSDTGNKVIDTALSTAASHPFITAGVVAAAAAPSAAVSLAKSAASSVGSSFAKSSLTTKAAVLTGGIVGGNVLLTSSKAREAVVQTPSNLANFGQNIGYFIDNPSLKSAANIVKENPLISSAAGAGILASVGAGTAAVIASAANTAALRSSTKQATTNTPQGAVAVGNDTRSILTTPENGSIATASSLNPVPNAVTPVTTSRSVPTKRRKSIAKPQNLNIRLYNYNQNGNNYRHT